MVSCDHFYIHLFLSSSSSSSILCIALHTSTINLQIFQYGVIAMITLCLLGRGGQGIKSAARIVGTAAFLGGWNVQDQPLYGAERRGGPVNAFIRISPDSILERGPVADPSLLIIADYTLLADPSMDDYKASASSGRSFVFVNSSKSPEYICSKYNITSSLWTLDLTEMAEEILGTQVISVALAGATGRMLNQDFRNLEQAITLELQSIGIGNKDIEKNVALAKRAFGSLMPVDIAEAPREERKEPNFVNLTYQGPLLSTCSIISAGNSQFRRVGEWSRFKPVINYNGCTKCRICFVYCPDSAITIGKDDYPIINYDACKGCDICHSECPVKVISLVKREGGN
jgi:pyruvate ferredoxin oxidoreductase gamma subunit